MSSEGFRQSIGLPMLVLIGVGIIVGAGIFVITGQAAAQYAGPAVILSFALAAIVCLFSALCYAELASMIPSCGSAFAFTREGFGNGLGWVVGWALMAEYLFALCAISIGWSAYSQGVLADFGLALPASWSQSPLAFDERGFRGTGATLNLPAALLVMAVTFANLTETRNSAKANAAIVIIKLSAVLLFILFGLAFSDSANWSPFLPAEEPRTDGTSAYGLPGVIKAAGVIFFAYLGFDVLAAAAQETRDPQRTVPRATMLTLGITVILYVGVALAMTGLVPFRQLNVEAPLTVALASVGAPLAWLKTYVGIAVSIGLIVGAWSCIFAVSRLIWALANAKLFPAGFALLHDRHGVPHRGALLAGAIATIIAATLPIALLGELISTGTLIAFICVCATVIRLRLRDPMRERPFRVPYAFVIAPLGIASSIFLLVGMGWPAIARIAAWQGIGAIVLLLVLAWNRSNRRLAAA